MTERGLRDVSAIDLIRELVDRGARVRRDSVIALDTLRMSWAERRSIRLLRGDEVGRPRRVTAPARPHSRIEALRDEPYLGWVRTLDCCTCGKPNESTASHMGDLRHGKGRGIKADDRTAVPQCWPCHWDWEHDKGRFDGMRKAERKAYAAEQIAKTQALWERLHPVAA